MTYEETLEHLFTKLPMYQRIGISAFKKDLTNIIQLCDALDNPQKKIKTIHIAGTNGKGSTSHILSAIYQKNGYKVGLYTSPHLIDFRERIKLNGQLCSKEFVISFTASIAHLIKEIQPSFFEITVAMAFSYFAEQKVDIAIIETGLGGRLDSTNIITPLTSIITSIGYDHKDMLGDTLELIAGEKAGIIKERAPLVTGNIAASPLAVIQQKAKEMNAPIYSYTDTVYSTDLKGKHQQWNIGCAMKCVSLNQDHLPTDETKTHEALLTICKLTSFEGRWQELAHKPLVICDVGHNEEGIRLLASEIVKLQLNAYFILGFVNDKDLDSIIPLLPEASSIALVKPNVIRGMNAIEAQTAFQRHGVETSTYTNLQDALDTSYERILKQGSPDKSLLFIGGSNFLVADLLLLKQHNKLPWKS
ncbi:MAG: dihydrofolate synthase/folylpolyglutamate synthase [Bacteroidia bacterium]